MTNPDFVGSWTIRASTSRFFPVQSLIELGPKKGKAAEFELEVTWEDQKDAKLKLLDRDFVQQGPDTVKGKFGHPKQGTASEQQEFELVVTVMRFADEQKRLIGALLQLSGREPGSLGVWVAEVEQGTGRGEE